MRNFSKLICAFALVALVSACGYDGHYRYSCQDPENWELEECNPPICEVDGNCTEVLLGFNPGETTAPDETIPVEETIAP
jgi:hypothetical protein